MDGPNKASACQKLMISVFWDRTGQEWTGQDRSGVLMVEFKQ
jgi:hypothetical protein